MQIIATHVVADVQHWCDNPNGPSSLRLAECRSRRFVIRPEPARPALLIDTPDLDTLQRALAEPEAAEAEAHDGVDPATLQIFVAG